MFGMNKSSVGAHRSDPGRTRRKTRSQCSVRLLIGGLLLGGSLAPPAEAQLRQIYHVPVDDADLRSFSASINTRNLGTTTGQNPNTVHSVISITAVTDGTILYYDHWEDGFESSLGAPAQVSTETIGDGIFSNGAPPGCGVDACDVVNAGDVLVLENDVASNPRNPAVILYDGGDQIASTELVSVTRAGWRLQEGTLLAGALELFPSFTWANRFELPLGIDINGACDPNASDTTSIAAGNICMFEYVAISISASATGAVIRTDVDADGTDDRTDILNPGETLFIEDLSLGATILSSDPIQVHVLTGDVGSNYEARWFSLIPTEQWDSSYYSPVGTTVTGDEVFVILYNPHSSAISVTADTQAGSSNVSVPAGGIAQFQMPANTGAHFYTASSQSFYAVSTTDYDATGHDWGFTLLPETELTSGVIVGWAPGRDPTSTVNPGENGSPVWVTAVGPTTIDVDFDGDGTIDQSTPVGALESLVIFDADGDQSGMQISTSDGTLMTAAWGQDPATASGAAPGLDLGTTVKPIPFLDIDKIAELAIDTNLNGAVDPGETLRYTITVSSVGRTVAPSVVLEDPTLDGNTTYIADSTEVNGVALPDDPGGSTLFPLDEGGINLGNIAPGETVLVTFLVVIDDPIAPGVTEILNSAIIRTVGGGGRSSTTTPVGTPGFTVVKTSDAIADVVPGDTITYSVTVTNTGVTTQVGIKILDSLPAGSAYVLESTTATGPTVSQQTLDYDNTATGGITGANNCNAGTVNWLQRTFVVSDSFAVNGVSLGFNATHPWRGDIEANLVSPTGTVVPVIVANGGDSDNNYDILLADGGSALDDGNADTTAAPFYDRTVAPAGPLSGFTGENSAGTWTLRMCDDFPGADDGTFNRAQLRLSGFTTSTLNKSNQAGAADPLLNGVPLNLVLAPDGFSLAPAASMTATYRVLVDDPLVPYQPAIVNVAQVTTLDHPFPVLGTVIDPVTEGATIGDRAWLDVDGDGIQDVGEAGLPNVVVNLYDAGADGLVGTADDVLFLTTSTDGGGNYIFQHLAPRTYYVDVDQTSVPAGLGTSPGTSDPSAAIPVSGVVQVLDIDFGYTNQVPGTALVGDFVWSDADGDGIQDPGEVGVAGVSLDLVDVSSGLAVATTTTGADGRYLFAGVPPDEYRVVVTDTASVLAAYTATVGPQSEGGTASAPLTVVASEVRLDVDFGFNNASGTYTISDVTWLDENADTVFDAGEPSLVNVTVRLIDGSGSVVTTTVSAPDGSFAFTGVAPGSYTIDIVDANGVLTSLGGTTPAALAGFVAVTVTNADLSAVNFGYRSPGTIGDLVWSDGDGDAVRDPGELGIGGVVVELLDGVGAVTASTTTAADGSYLFEALQQGFYTTRIAAVNFNTGAALEAYVQTADPDVSLDHQSTLGLEFSQANLTQDYGYRNAALADVSGTVFEDLDQDGLEDIGEPGLGGVTVSLVDATSVVIATAITDANGNYLFPDVPDGDYTVDVTDNAAVLSGYQNTNGLDQQPVTVVGVDVTDVDFGYIRDPSTGSLGDTVFHDLDGDGILDGSEPGLSNVVVQLWSDTDVDGVFNAATDTLVRSTTANANGRYDFAGLAAGDYFAFVDTSTLPSGLTSTSGGDISALVVLSDGEDYDLADFGYGSAPGTVSIGDLVFADVDGDGFQDFGEVGIGGVSVTVSGPSGSVVVTTNPDGSYLVAGLPPGNYTVSVNPVTIPGTYATSPTNGPNSRNYTLVADDDLLHADFGYLPAGASGAIGDRVYLDSDADSAQSAGEPGLAGVSLDLLDSSGNVIASTTTDANGNYDFVGLQPDIYQVVVTDLNGIASGLNATQTAPVSFTVTAAGEDFDNADFGYAPSNGSGSIGGTVWLDVDQTFGPGTLDTGETGLQGVSVELWVDTNGDGSITPGVDNLARTALSDVNGDFLFTGMPLGDYLVRVTDNFGVLAGTSLVAGPNPGVDSNSQSNPYAVTLAAGTPFNFTADFGYQAAVQNTLAGVSFFDAQGDGSLNGVDAGVGGVALTLYRDLNGNGVLDPSEGVFGQVISDTSGNYLFAGLPDGSWIVAADTSGSFLAGTTQTTQQASAGVQPVAALGGQNITGQNFGFFLGGPTLALISHFGASVDGGRVVVEWETASEAGTLGFYVFRWGGSGTGWIQINQTMLPGLVDSPLGGRYRLVDEGAPQAESLTYELLEVEVGGVERHYGPYRIAPGGSSTTNRAMDHSYSARRRLATKLVRERLRKARADRYAARLAQREARLAERALLRAARRGEAKIFIGETGLYFVPASDIAEALGLSLSRVQRRLESGRLALSSGGSEVAWTHSGDASGMFFYAVATESSFASENVYWLTRDRGRQMEVSSGGAPASSLGGSFMSTELAEEDLFAATLIPQDPTSDFWFWKSVIAGLPTWGRRDFNIYLPSVDAQNQATVRVTVQSASDTTAVEDHHAKVYVNGTSVGDARWDGLSREELSFAFDASLLASGNNVVEVEALLDTGAAYGYLYVDSVAITYPRRFEAFGGELDVTLADTASGGPITIDGFDSEYVSVFDITQPNLPKMLVELNVETDARSRVSFVARAGARYYAVDTTANRLSNQMMRDVPGLLRRSSNRADYLLISPDELLDGAKGLADYRRSQGLNARVVRLGDVYDEFNYGVQSPLAIRDFLAYVHSSWASVPEYVVLLGKGTFDYKGGAENLLPALLSSSPHGMYASDNALADVVGDDHLPEFRIGRIPVLSEAELAAYLDKLQVFESEIGSRERVVLVADDPDSAGDFVADSLALSSRLPEQVPVSTVFLSELSLNDARIKLFDELHKPQRLVNYMGHGGLDRMANEGLLLSTDAAALGSAPASIFASLTCTIGRFEVPGLVSLAESLLAEPGAAVAVWSPTGLSHHNQAMVLNRAFVDAYFDPSTERLGDAVHAALQELASQNAIPFMLDIYTILGDPATKIR